MYSLSFAGTPPWPPQACVLAFAKNRLLFPCLASRMAPEVDLADLTLLL
jgi:hypothetical protein